MLHGAQHGVKELGKDHEIDGDVLPAGREDFLHRMLVHEEQVALLQRDPVAVDDVRGRTFAHVDKLHIVVGVERKMDKARVGTDVDQLAV